MVFYHIRLPRDGHFPERVTAAQEGGVPALVVQVVDVDVAGRLRPGVQYDGPVLFELRGGSAEEDDEPPVDGDDTVAGQRDGQAVHGGSHAVVPHLGPLGLPIGPLPALQRVAGSEACVRVESGELQNFIALEITI